MPFRSIFEGDPVLGWAIDSFDEFYKAISSDRNFNFEDELKRYKNRVFDNKIAPLFENAPFKLNLGGQTEKSRLVTTDKPTGIFDFSLASRGLYKVPEYYSEQLAIKYPDKFKEFELPSGVVPPNLVSQDYVLGNKRYYYNDGSEVFNCEVRQKGQTAIDDGIQGAKLKYATRNRKVFLTYKRNRGKVKYVEIYSLFYYTSLSGDVQYAVRHIPALMIGEYLESIGVKTRIYMTRFVRLYDRTYRLRKYDVGNNFELPLYEDAPNKSNDNNLFIQPIIVKEFGQEFDKAMGFMISSRNFETAYRVIATDALRKEVTNENIYPFGDPDWSQNDYFEGLERYRNKYQEYVKLGIFKSKEVLPEAMLFFHDMAIKKYLERFTNEMSSMLGAQNINTGSHTEVYTNVEVNPFFTWWMQMSALNLKHKIEIINSNELRKDLTEIKRTIESKIEEVDRIISNAPKWKNGSDKFPDLLLMFKNYILREYDIYNTNLEFSFMNYILNITLEITTYAEGIFFPTEQDRQNLRNDLVKTVLEELSNI